MATYTPNYNLSKPDAGDQFGNFRQSYNDNMDIIDQNLGGGGGGGDSVAWSQIVTTGVKIAEITINGTQTDVYVPNGGGGGGRRLGGAYMSIQYNKGLFGIAGEPTVYP